MSRAQLDTLWTYIGHKGEKKDFQKKKTASCSGAGRRSPPTRDSGSGASGRVDHPPPRAFSKALFFSWRNF
jgi:hypothetical protein